MELTRSIERRSLRLPSRRSVGRVVALLAVSLAAACSSGGSGSAETGQHNPHYTANAPKGGMSMDEAEKKADQASDQALAGFKKDLKRHKATVLMGGCAVWPNADGAATVTLNPGLVKDKNIGDTKVTMLIYSSAGDGGKNDSIDVGVGARQITFENGGFFNEEAVVVTPDDAEVPAPTEVTLREGYGHSKDGTPTFVDAVSGEAVIETFGTNSPYSADKALAACQNVYRLYHASAQNNAS